MKLIVNFGNSDLKLICKKSSEIFVFRSRNKYYDELNKLVNLISDRNLEFDKEGNVLTSVSLDFIDNNIDINYEIERIEFPILKKEIDKIEEFENKKISEVVCFITKQEKKVPTDTYLLKLILQGRYGQTVFPNINFKFITITENPADYSIIIPLYSKFLSKINLDNTVISVSQGTPAMCVGLCQSCARLKPNIRQYYASNSHETDEIIIKQLKQFSHEEITLLIDDLETDLSNGNYVLAKTKVLKNYLSTFQPLVDILDYFINRKNYKFNEALEKINSVSKKSPVFNIITKDIVENLNFILEANPEEFNYSNPKCPYLLYETLSNIKMSLKNKEYFYTMALMSAFLDVLSDFMIVKALSLEKLTFINKSNSFKEINEYIKSHIKQYPITNKDGDLKKKLHEDEYGNFYLNMNVNSRRKLFEWVNKHSELDITVLSYMEFMKKNQNFIKFKDLRNKLPIAHSVKGVSLEVINQTLREVDSTNNISKVINDLEMLIRQTLPTEKEFGYYFLDYNKFVDQLRKLFVK